MTQKITTIYNCSNCDAQYSRWQGRCNECGAWGTLVQTVGQIDKKQNANIKADTPINLNGIKIDSQSRIKINIEEIDRVLGGGIVPGSLILLGGDPGIGKSTLALQIAKNIPNTLYISGEESAGQVKLRADRVKLDYDNFKFLPQTDADKIISTIKDTQPELVIIDSIQTMNYSESPAGLGTASQITACTTQLLEVAKTTNIPIIIIGHVTKEGYVAGPKTLEHLVDTVLYLESDNKNFYKILRSVKNRFGSTGEIGVFEMTGFGLAEIKNPTKAFTTDHENKSVAGSITSVLMEGQRPFLVEIQALVAKTAFGYPQRKTAGFDLNRLQMIIAVITKISKINLGNQDVYLNVAGGLKIKETAPDLAVALAIVSAYLNLAINPKTVALGEIGLSGEIRNIANIARRITEAKKLNFSPIIAPASEKDVIMVKNIVEAIKILNA
ncbi:MAG TPA: DNA repair protein RadA [Patescibacteria group bacterium]|nr:DNA repair protein RadA [Patescibacteria group bacterium]